MQRFKSFTWCASVLCLGAVNAAHADGVSVINSDVVSIHEFHDIPTATPFVFNNYSSFVLFSETGVSTNNSNLFADRDVWRFSADGSTPFQIGPKDYFSATMTLSLTGNPATPRKEAGWLYSTANAGDIQFIVDTDQHEVVQFGGISFYSFSGQGLVPPYQSGASVTLGIKYFVDPGTGANALQFSANNVQSPIFDFGPGIGAGETDPGLGTLGGYFQIVNDPTNPSNGGDALFSNISIVPAPEPSVVAFVGAGLLSLVLIRRRR